MVRIARFGKSLQTFLYLSAAVGNKSLGESVVAFALAGDLGSPSVISFNIKIAFATDGEKTRLLNSEVLLCVGAGDLARSKK